RSVYTTVLAPEDKDTIHPIRNSKPVFFIVSFPCHKISEQREENRNKNQQTILFCKMQKNTCPRFLYAMTHNVE
ncbi:hypothetical protein, partial [Xenorhabdus szentirmaii]|uniref:hypothetical protein n=1 Tax=Xenorhabdus szentirmaii TaxID=290112 RepID=UPI002B406BAE